MIQAISEPLQTSSAATITLRLLVGDLYRLGDLKISKIKRPANLNLSLSEFAQLNMGLGFSLENLSL